MWSARYEVRFSDVSRVWVEVNVWEDVKETGLGFSTRDAGALSIFPCRTARELILGELRVVQLLLTLQKEQSCFVLIGNSEEPSNNWKITSFVSTSEIIETLVSTSFVKLRRALCLRLSERSWVQLTENIVCRAPQCWFGFPFETVSSLVSQLHLIQTKFSFLSSPVSLFFVLWLSPKSSLIPHDPVSWCTHKRKVLPIHVCRTWQENGSSDLGIRNKRKDWHFKQEKHWSRAENLEEFCSVSCFSSPVWKNWADVI